MPSQPAGPRRVPSARLQILAVCVVLVAISVFLFVFNSPNSPSHPRFIFSAGNLGQLNSTGDIQLKLEKSVDHQTSTEGLPIPGTSTSSIQQLLIGGRPQSVLLARGSRHDMGPSAAKCLDPAIGDVQGDVSKLKEVAWGQLAKNTAQVYVFELRKISIRKTSRSATPASSSPSDTIHSTSRNRARADSRRFIAVEEYSPTCLLAKFVIFP